MKGPVLTIAGSDCSGRAGIQADLLACFHRRCASVSVVTAVTAQGPGGVRDWEPVAAELVRAQLAAVLDDGPPAAAKTGMLATAEVVRAVAAELRARGGFPLVCDPVAVSSSGAALLREGGWDALRTDLLPLATIVTPNAAEARGLSGITVRNPDDARRAGKAILATGVAAVLVTGGHLEEARGTDVLVTPAGTREYSAEDLDAGDVRGTGCALSTAIACSLARGVPLEIAVWEGKHFIGEWIRRGGARGMASVVPDGR